MPEAQDWTRKWGEGQAVGVDWKVGTSCRSDPDSGGGLEVDREVGGRESPRSGLVSVGEDQKVGERGKPIKLTNQNKKLIDFKAYLDLV